MNAPIKPRQSRLTRMAVKQAVICPYCDDEAALVTGRVIYPHRRDLYGRLFYHCEPCGAHVGCHRPRTQHGVDTVPLGRLANAELRQLKREAHDAFDPLWSQGNKKRGAAYRWLSNAMGLSANQCHIGMFDPAQCRQVVRLCQSR